MNALISIYLFILGLVLGSFFNVVGLRVPLKQSIVHPPSTCPHCANRLQAKQLIPVVSWLLSRGKCSFCKSSISPVYPLGELATGFLFVWIYLTFGNTRETVVGLVLVSLCVIVTVSDLKYMLIPNRILLAFAPVFLLLRVLFPAGSVWQHVWGALLGGGVLMLIVFVSRGGMGLGDVKLFALLGWIIGFPNVIVAFLLAFLAGTLIGGALLLTGVIQKKQPVPFGPYLAFGALLAFTYGADWIPLYLSLFH
ncbi:prepilin peptidase [Paenibacillus nanensis]|uniref:Prepilin peptidase n=1 Tax=Paenibacillus nanensis TaxID=393251 RepID=A0A3A1V0K3_9BACL|nr:A24 family peptidase [Paenibacillus nanensis]RIX54045.1 prepilin peptidase [Paenibacillus nanensis]